MPIDDRRLMVEGTKSKYVFIKDKKIRNFGNF